MNCNFFIEKEKCFFRVDDNYYEIESDDPIKIMEMGNDYLKGKTPKNIYESDYLEIKELVEELKNSSNIEFSLFSNDPHLFTTFGEIKDIESNCLNDTPKIVILNNVSLNDVKVMNLNNMSNVVFVLNFNTHYLITQFIDHENKMVCLECTLTRFAEANPDYFRYENDYLYKSLGNELNVNIEILLEIARETLKNKENSVTLFNKITKKIEYGRPKKITTCKRCFEGNILHLGDINISENLCEFQESGVRKYSKDISLMKLEENVNVLGPVILIEGSAFYDKLESFVFQSEISRDNRKINFPYHGGKGFDYTQAKCSAIAEAMERYNSKQFGNEFQIESSYNELVKTTSNVLNPKELNLDKEYTYPYDDNKVIHWVEAKCLTNEEIYYIPSNVVFFPYIPEKREMQFIPQDTTGLAAGLTIEEALIQGIYEVIERDAYSIYYRNNMSSKTIFLDNITSEKLKVLLQKLNNKNIKLHLKLLETDLDVYVVHCTTEDLDNNFPIFTHGAGASANCEIAIMRAITECIQLRVSQLEVYKNKTQFEEDISYRPYFTWGNGERENFEMLLNNYGDEIINLSVLDKKTFPSFAQEIKYLSNQIKKNGHHIFVSNLSRKDNSVKTVRVIVPGFQCCDDSLRRNTERMKMLPNKLGKQKLSELFSEPFFS